MPKYASFPKMGKCGKPCKIKGKTTYKEKCEHDKNTIHLPRQESEYELTGGLWRLKCGKLGQKKQRGTTILLRMKGIKLGSIKAAFFCI